MKIRNQYFLYIAFAVICIFVNLGSQIIIELILRPVDALNVVVYEKTVVEESLTETDDEELIETDTKPVKLYDLIKIAVGTILGFMTKFVLDKFFVFREKQKSISHTFKQIIIYGFLAVFTTLIFWSFQLGFKLVFGSGVIEYIGAVLGLAIGYTIKFFLDKKFVFVN
jgi:putative flippase GtrA